MAFVAAISAILGIPLGAVLVFGPILVALSVVVLVVVSLKQNESATSSENLAKPKAAPSERERAERLRDELLDKHRRH
jgi:hypothetical protein